MNFKLFVLLFFISISFKIIAQSTDLDLQVRQSTKELSRKNTIQSLIDDLKFGVTTINLDVLITKDKKAVVCEKDILGLSNTIDSYKTIQQEKNNSCNIFKHDYYEIIESDTNPKFYKPLLSDVIKSVQRYVKGNTLFEVNYSIQINSTELSDNVFHPSYDEFSDIVFGVIDDYLPWERVIIQSFDYHVLRYWRIHHPKVRLSLMDNNSLTFIENIKSLGFKPDVYSPNKTKLSKNKVKKIKERGVKVIPWVVNNKTQMKRLIAWNVDGFITEYPDKAVELSLIDKN